MRKYKRAVAHHRMEMCGYTKMNKTMWDPETRKPIPSHFAQTWRKIITPGTPHFKEYQRMSQRMGTA